MAEIEVIIEDDLLLRLDIYRGCPHVCMCGFFGHVHASRQGETGALVVLTQECVQ